MSEKDPLVSVIIPVYNTLETYMEECFDSIKKQTYSAIEVVIVDDGSRQETAKFLDAYVEHLSNWRVVHKKNGGVSSARNTGIVEAQGEYIQLLDSDDFLEKETITECVAMAIAEQSDIVLYSIAQCDETLTRVDYIQDYGLLNTPRKPFTLNDLDSSGAFILEQMHPQPANKIIRRDLLIDNNITFPTDIRIGEDHVFSFLISFYAKRISVIDEPFFRYRVFSGGAMGSAYKYPTDAIRAFRVVKGLLESQGMLDRWRDSFVRFIVSNVRYNRWCFKDNYDAINELFVEANKLIDDVSSEALNQPMKDNETVVGLKMAKKDSKLLMGYYKLIYKHEQELSSLRDAVHEKNTAYEFARQAAENTPGVRQSARNVSEALKRKIGRGA